ncbi:MAG TPA: hypothetical protein VF538_02035 [Pyrinomonadaceae bacterium]
MLELEYKDPQHEAYRSQWITLDSDHTSYDWTIEVPSPAAGCAFYSGLFEYAGGQAAPLALNAAQGYAINIGDVPQPETVAILPLELDWTQLEEVSVTLVQDGTHQETSVFRSDNPGAKYWASPAGNPPSYTWSASYKFKSGLAYDAPQTTGTEPLLVVPPPPPGFELSVSVADAYFALLPLSQIEVTVTDGAGKTVKHIFNSGNAGSPWTLLIWKQKDGAGNWVGLFSYQYKVSFKDGQFPDFTSPVFPEIEEHEVVVSQVGLMGFSASGVNFEIVKEVKASYKFNLEPRSFSLKAASPLKILSANRDYSPYEPFEYDLEYITQYGSYVERGLLAQTAWTLFQCPFTPKLVQFFPVGLTGTSPPLQRIQLTYSHIETGPGWQLSSETRTATLSAKEVVCQWTFPTVDPARAVLIYQGTIIKSDGRIVHIPKTTAPLDVVPVGNTSMWYSVEISPAQVDWARFRLVSVTIYTKSAAKPINTKVFRFQPGSVSEFWGFFPFDNSSTYFWTAKYYPRTGTPVDVPEQTGTLPMLVLPKEPS